MSKRNEIRQKEQIQLQLQAQFNKLDQTVLSWLSNPVESETTKQGSTTSSISEQFANQIVIPSGKGINFEASEEPNHIGANNSDTKVVTINDFLDNVSTNKKARDRTNNSNDRISKVGEVKRRNGASNSLRALTNKLRDGRRQSSKEFNNEKKKTPLKYQQNVSKKGTTKRSITDTKNESDSDSEDDDEVLIRKRKSSKDVSYKAIRNKRPF